MRRRRKNPRHTFVDSTELKIRARELRRRRWSTPEQGRAKTVRIERRELVMNPKRGKKSRRWARQFVSAPSNYGAVRVGRMLYKASRHGKAGKSWIFMEPRTSRSVCVNTLRRNPKRHTGRKSRRWSKFEDADGSSLHNYLGAAMRKSRRKASAHGRKRRNPGVFATVAEAVRAFKHQYGGQAMGWAQDAVSTARTSETARFWEKVVLILRREMYRTNPKRSRSYRPVGRMRHNWKEGVNRKGRSGARSTLKRRLRRAERRDTSWRSNPKRDGTPTRGERRGDKYKDHLRKIRERGQKAAEELNKLLGRESAAPVGHAEPAFKAPKTETQEAHPGHYAAELSSEQKAMREQLASVNALMGDIRDQLRDIGDDETLADGLSEQLIKLGKQRKALMDLATPAQTNPRRRAGMFRLRRFHPARIAAYRRALRELRNAVRSLR